MEQAFEILAQVQKIKEVDITVEGNEYIDTCFLGDRPGVAPFRWRRTWPPNKISLTCKTVFYIIALHENTFLSVSEKHSLMNR
jgi:hypothetical protein